MHIDKWTLALQTVNVLVLIWILARFFFRPVMDIVAKRQQEANKLSADAAADRQQAAQARAAADKARADISAEHDRLIAEARQAAQAEKQNLLAQAAQEIAKLRGDAAAAISRDRAAAEQAIIARASELAVDIARRLLGRFPPDVALSAFLDGLARELQAMAATERQSLAAAGHAIEVVTAAALSDADKEHVRAALEKALGARPELVFRADAAIIAGIELRFRNTIVRNNWRADLDRIVEELSRDEHARKA
jgi:F-type H+-transporting ATPase subunit b